MSQDEFKSREFNLQTKIEGKVALVATALTAPHVLMRPTLTVDGTRWCALYGSNLEDGLAGFGTTPEEACLDFDRVWREGKMGPNTTNPDLTRLEIKRLRTENKWLRTHYSLVVEEHNELLAQYREAVYAKDGKMPEELEFQTALIPKYEGPSS